MANSSYTTSVMSKPEKAIEITNKTGMNFPEHYFVQIYFCPQHYFGITSQQD